MGIQKIIAGVGLLIFAFLLLNNGKETVSVIESISKSSVSAIKTLQGRT